MWKRLASLVMLSVAACGGGDAPPPDQAADTTATAPASLYDRLGGLTAITTVVDSFIGRSAADTRINKKFAKSDIPRLRFHLIEQVCNATGGPCDYTGRDMPTAHTNMGVTDGEFDALVENLTATMDQLGVPAAEKNELLGILGPLRAQIVTVTGPATGTALPAAFQPAPALDSAKLQGGPARR
ncbi:MAG: group I truncated hemoglobin [Longimicrobiales bacterium]